MGVDLKPGETIGIRDYGWLLTQDAMQLSMSQRQTKRDFDFETVVANRTISMIADVTKSWHPDFSPTVTVRTSKRILRSAYLPPSAVKDRRELIEFMDRNNLTFEIHGDYPTNEIHTYLGGFQNGVDLGYPEELGDMWYLTLSDNNGTYYIPVDGINAIKGIGN